MAWRNRLSQLMLTVAALAPVACTGGTYWTNPGFGPEMQQRQFTLDSTDCVARANQLIPEPQRPQRPQRPQPQSGTVYLDTPGGPVHGTYNSDNGQPPTPFGAESVCGSISACMQQEERKQSRNKYATACMEDRGWQQRSAGRSKSSQTIESPSATMVCKIDSDCGQGRSCRSKKGGGTECRGSSDLGGKD